MELLVQSGPDAGKVFQLGTTPLVAGRQAGTGILLNDGQASRRHASFEVVNGTLLVSDLGSANGTSVNGQLLNPNQPRSLRAGDVVTIGSTTLAVRGEAAPGAYNQAAPGYGQLANPASGYGQPVNPTPDYGQPATPNYNQPASPASGYGQSANPGYNQPAPGYNQPAAQPSAYQPPSAYQEPAFNAPPSYNQNGPVGPAPSNYPAGPAPYNPPATPPGYGMAPPALVQPVKKSRTGLLVGLGLIVVVAVAAIVGIIALAGGKNDNNPTPQAQVTTAPSPPPPLPTIQVGLTGTNNLPPSPPANVGQAPTPVPTQAAAPPANPTASPNQPASTPGNGNPPAKGGETTGLGMSVTYPADWKTVVNENKNLIESDAPDGVTYSIVLRVAGIKGTAADRLKKYITAITDNLPDLKVTREVKAGQSDDQVADAYVTYTDKSDNLLHRDYLVAATNSSDDTYFLSFSTDDQKFDSQTATFSTILKSVKI